jgi:N-formylglutamate deformylase
LIVDFHRFTSRPLPCDMDQMAPRPDFCVGTDPFHTSAGLLNRALTVIGVQGYRVMVNRPYSGTIVPVYEYQKDKAVISIMIEVRRDLYMDQTTGAKNKDFHKTRSAIADLLKALLPGASDKPF